MLQMAASCTKNAACFRVIAPAPPSLSKGNVQRVQILCTLAQDPDTLLHSDQGSQHISEQGH